MNKKKYNRIIFDLDHTLWDFDKNSNETLGELYKIHDLQNHTNQSIDLFCANYKQINEHLWRLYDNKKITKKELRTERFRMVFKKCGFINDELALQFENQYLEICPTKPHVFPNVFQTLDIIKQKHSIDIITNGFCETQDRKLHHSHLMPYVSEITTAENSGYSKPDPKIFKYHLDKVKETADNCLFIGDNPFTDIKGAKSVKMDAILFNPEKSTKFKNSKHDAMIHDISSLLDLILI